MDVFRAAGTLALALCLASPALAWSQDQAPAGQTQDKQKEKEKTDSTPPKQDKADDKVDHPADHLPDSLTTEDTRMTVGFNSNIISGAPRSFTFLFDFALTAPLTPGRVTRTHKRAFDAWTNIRLSGQAQSTTPSIKQFVGGFENDVLTGSVTDVVEVADVLLGGETKLWTGNNGFDFGDHYQFQPLLFFGGGFTTTPPKGGPIPIFEMTDQAKMLYVPSTDTKTYKYIGFAQPDKRSFDPQFYLGLRMRTHHFIDCTKKSIDCDPDSRVNFPGTIDLSVGWNSALAGGAFGSRAFLFKLDAFYPLPTDNLANAIYLFGSADVLFHRPSEMTPVFLKAPSASVTVPSDDLYIYTLTEEDRRRDSWQFGVAVDLVRIFKGAANSSDATKSSVSDPGPEVVANEDVTVRRMNLVKGDKASLTSALDILIATNPTTIKVSTKTSSNTTDLKIGGTLPLDAGTHTLENMTPTPFEALVARQLTKDSGAEVPEWKLSPESPAPTTERTTVRPEFIVDRIRLNAGGEVSGEVKGRTLLILALEEPPTQQSGPETGKKTSGSMAEQSAAVAGKTAEESTARQPTDEAGKQAKESTAGQSATAAGKTTKGSTNEQFAAEVVEKGSTDKSTPLQGSPLLLKHNAHFEITAKKEVSILLISFR